MLGLVVHADRSLDARISNIVFVNKDKPLFYIRKPDTRHLRKLPKEERKLIEKELKRKELEFGDWIKFNKIQIRGQFIEDYKKELPLFNVRCHKESFQIKTTCLFSPSLNGNPPQCISEYFGQIHVDPEIANRFLPNIVINAWLSIRVSQLFSLVVSFDDYEDICDCQEMACCAPWNQTDSRFGLNLASVDPFAEGVDEQESASLLGADDPAVIYDRVGILTGKRKLFVQSLSDYSIIIGYLDPFINIELGSRVEFDAVYNIYLNAYITRHYRCAETLLNFGNKKVETTAGSFADSSLPFGYLWTKEKCFGVVKDNDGILIPFLLEDSHKNVISVLVEDIGPQRFCRFAIRGVSQKSRQKVEQARRQIINLPETFGFLIQDAVVFVPEYSVIRLSYDKKDFPDFEDKPLGTWVNVSAVCYHPDVRKPVFHVTSMKTFRSEAYPPVEVVMNGTEILYRAICKYDREVGAFRSPNYGFVTDPKNLIARISNKNTCVLWLTYDPENFRTPFIVHSYEKELGAGEVQKSLGVNVLNVPIVSGSSGRCTSISGVIDKAAASGSHGISKGNEIGVLKEDSVDGINSTPCQSTNCFGFRLLRRVLNEKILIKEYNKTGGGDIIVKMAICISRE